MKRTILFLLFVSFAAGAPAMAKTLSQVAAVVNHEMISTYQLDKAVLKALSQQANKNQLSATQFDQLKTTLLQQLINDKLVEQRIEELGLTVADSELNAAILDVQEKNGLTSETLEQALAAQGLTMESYREQIKKEILRYKLLGREVNYKVMVTSSEVRDYFDEHIDEYKVQPTIQVSRISYAIPPESSEQKLTDLRKQARITRDLLVNGEPFDQVLAAQEDIASGGDMGKLVETDLAEDLQIALKDLQPGEVSEILEMNNQLHLFLMTARNSGDVNLFERVKADIEETLKREKTDTRFQEWEKELRANAFVDVRI
ncbi:MAG: SurA N-terminal domain-containing protein [Deltaproteobacteria bacterium]|nr:SurA N-terminal domain-containing protein [Deltaproteobacteria bacterium]MCW9049135.1 SurA N-terminal domain-containing protein [Deltaproteobacteria bacterium]